MNQQIQRQKITGILMMSYFLLTLISFFILAAVFEFPDILRDGGQQRLELFNQNQSLIVPAYYLWSMTGLLQIFIAVQLSSLGEKKGAINQAALVAGVLGGVFQIIGYIRWIVLIPLLSSAYETGEISRELIFFLEKTANSYLGMTLGEHLGNLLLGLWLFLLGFQLYGVRLVHKSMAVMALFMGVLFLVFSFEPLGEIFSWMSGLTVPVWGFYNVWLVFMTITLFKRSDDEQAECLPWPVWIGGFLFWLANVIPAFV